MSKLIRKLLYKHYRKRWKIIHSKKIILFRFVTSDINKSENWKLKLILLSRRFLGSGDLVICKKWISGCDFWGLRVREQRNRGEYGGVNQFYGTVLLFLGSSLSKFTRYFNPTSNVRTWSIFFYYVMTSFLWHFLKTVSVYKNGPNFRPGAQSEKKTFDVGGYVR